MYIVRPVLIPCTARTDYIPLSAIRPLSVIRPYVHSVRHDRFTFSISRTHIYTIYYIDLYIRTRSRIIIFSVLDNINILYLYYLHYIYILHIMTYIIVAVVNTLKLQYILTLDL